MIGIVPRACAAFAPALRIWKASCMPSASSQEGTFEPVNIVSKNVWPGNRAWYSVDSSSWKFTMLSFSPLVGSGQKQKAMKSYSYMLLQPRTAALSSMWNRLVSTVPMPRMDTFGSAKPWTKFEDAKIKFDIRFVKIAFPRALCSGPAAANRSPKLKTSSQRFHVGDMSAKILRNSLKKSPPNKTEGSAARTTSSKTNIVWARSSASKALTWCRRYSSSVSDAFGLPALAPISVATWVKLTKAQACAPAVLLKLHGRSSSPAPSSVVEISDVASCAVRHFPLRRLTM
mmetsp:Transcript_43010/g.125053  ORF Transcript_43010/g.125053 Transcript_43010/m.125053 type:complete len:287 (+) Transcript_43010:2130-2990(+)